MREENKMIKDIEEIRRMMIIDTAVSRTRGNTKR
jgi:hypothetical protein